MMETPLGADTTPQALERNSVCLVYPRMKSDLRVALCGGGLSSFAARVNISKQIASGLIALHEKGIVHRDLKLENVLIDEDNSIKICDFGTVRKTHTSSGDDKKTQGIIGSNLYIDPEVQRLHEDKKQQKKNARVSISRGAISKSVCSSAVERNVGPSASRFPLALALFC
jgi:serine/threonine protein kinase